MSRVLCVDDEAPILKALAVNLKARDYDVDLAATGEDALRKAADHPPDAVILDLGLPGISGVEVIKGIRGWSEVPIIVLSARDAEHDKIAALDAGADDYVTKPFGMGELLARLRAAMRRAAPAGGESIAVGGLLVDFDRHEVTVDGMPVQVTRIEYDLLSLFVRNEGKLLTHRTILREVWGPAYQI